MEKTFPRVGEKSHAEKTILKKLRFMFKFVSYTYHFPEGLSYRIKQQKHFIGFKNFTGRLQKYPEFLFLTKPRNNPGYHQFYFEISNFVQRSDIFCGATQKQSLISLSCSVLICCAKLYYG